MYYFYSCANVVRYVEFFSHFFTPHPPFQADGPSIRCPGGSVIPGGLRGCDKAALPMTEMTQNDQCG